MKKKSKYYYLRGNDIVEGMATGPILDKKSGIKMHRLDIGGMDFLVPSDLYHFGSKPTPLGVLD